MNVEPLADLVLGHYGGSTQALLDAATRFHHDLDALQAKKLEGPRLQYHRLRSKWPAEKCDELERMMEAMDIPFFERCTVSNSFVYHDNKTVYAVPTVLPASLGAVGLAGGIAGAAYVGFSALSLGAGALALLGVTGLVSAYDASLTESPFTELGDHLLSHAVNYKSARAGERVVQRLREQKII